MAGTAVGTQSGGPRSFADLGSGGGAPALVLLGLWTDSFAVLIEAAQRRAAFLVESLERLGWAQRSEVVEARAEEVGRDVTYRQRFELVTARSFGSPAVTAECGAPLLAVGGILVVSEPPSAPERWPDAALSQLGLGSGTSTEVGGYHFRILPQDDPCPERFPRRTGVPSRRPLF
ncbi:MAG: RsmG family class I SAM-dependent methyltransferase [Acidimicrobiales bacterium]